MNFIRGPGMYNPQQFMQGAGQQFGYQPQMQRPSPFSGVLQGQQYQPQMGMPLSGLRQPGMPSYARGTSYVPRTGPAFLHEGEAVISAPKAKKMRKVPLSSLLKVRP